jgi:putrescine transport system substrate-binding protein
MARITNFVTYPNAVPASLPMIDREVAENPMIFPPQEIRAKLFLLAPQQMATQRTLDRLWQRVVSGS